jgi:two-component system, chemotaxis family, protein-glutamate methylesterase/glutaminase
MNDHALPVSTSPRPAPIRLLLCDGSALVRSTLSRLLAGHATVTLVDTARNLREAVEKTALLHPDVVAIDVEAPTFGGPQSAAEILRAGSSPVSDGPIVLACCRESSSGAHTGLRALAEGASDVLVLHAERLSKEPNVCRDELVRAAVSLVEDRRLDRRRPVMRVFASFSAERPRAGIVAIGGGEGSAASLEHLLEQLPPSLPCPIVVAPRMEPCFTRALAERLDSASAVSVVHGESGMPLHPGTAYVIPGDRTGRVRSLGPGPARLELVAPSQPGSSIDQIFSSCARQMRSASVGIVLSGAGEHGSVGGREVTAAGGALLTLDPAEALCAGMPLAAMRVGATAMGLPQIVEHIRTIGVPLARAA